MTEPEDTNTEKSVQVTEQTPEMDEKNLNAGFDGAAEENDNTAKADKAADDKEQKAGFKAGAAGATSAEEVDPGEKDTTVPDDGKEKAGAETGKETATAVPEDAEKFWGKLTGIRPDARVIAVSQPFKDWLAKQPADVQEKANRMDVDDARWVLAAWDDAQTGKETSSAADKTGTETGAKTELAAVDLTQDPAAIVKALGIDQLKVANVNEGVKGDWTMAQFAEQYPDLVPAIVAIVQHMAGKASPKFDLNGDPVVTGLKNTMSAIQYWDDVRDTYPDGKTIARSADFINWLPKQPTSVQKWAKSGDPADMVTLIKSYKDEKSRTATEKVKQDKTADKKKIDGLHSETLRTGAKTAPGQAQVQDENDLNAGFDAAGEPAA